MSDGHFHPGDNFIQLVNHARLYMTHYAQFEEPDPGVPLAVYIDAQTGLPTNELILWPPVNQRTWKRDKNPTRITAPTETSKKLPYFVSPPGFPPLPAPDPIVAVIHAVTQLPNDIIRANTSVLLVAIGQFIGEGATTGRLEGSDFEVVKQMHFEVRVRIGFSFTPPPGVAAPPVAVLVGWLDIGTVHQLIGLPPPPDPTQIVVYSWRAPMTLSTRTEYVRSTATEPQPVADPFPDGETQVDFKGARVGADGSYTLVGFAKPQDVQFIAPPELVQFLFGVNQLTDVEFAVEERGVLVPI